MQTGAQRHIRIGLAKEIQQLNEHSSQRRLSWSFLYLVLTIQQETAHLIRRKDLVTQIERHDRGLSGDVLVMEYLSSGFRVNQDVEFGPGRYISDTLLIIHHAHDGVGEAVAN